MFHSKQRDNLTGQNIDAGREHHHQEHQRTLPILPGIKDADLQDLVLDLTPELLAKLRNCA